jgi:hypothetical protein
MIELIARLRNISVVQAAQEIARHFAADPAHDGEEVEDEIINSPVGALRPRHEAVQALGIRPETAKAFGAGYSAELQGQFVIPIFDARGAYVSYTGIKRDESDFYPEKIRRDTCTLQRASGVSVGVPVCDGSSPQGAARSPGWHRECRLDFRLL